jgi:hypothetical protein
MTTRTPPDNNPDAIEVDPTYEDQVEVLRAEMQALQNSFLKEKASALERENELQESRRELQQMRENIAKANQQKPLEPTVEIKGEKEKLPVKVGYQTLGATSINQSSYARSIAMASENVDDTIIKEMIDVEGSKNTVVDLSDDVATAVKQGNELTNFKGANEFETFMVELVQLIGNVA